VHCSLIDIKVLPKFSDNYSILFFCRKRLSFFFVILKLVKSHGLFSYWHQKGYPYFFRRRSCIWTEITYIWHLEYWAFSFVALHLDLFHLKGYIWSMDKSIIVWRQQCNNYSHYLGLWQFLYMKYREDENLKIIWHRKQINESFWKNFRGI
jgi:hypothetical protein